MHRAGATGIMTMQVGALREDKCDILTVSYPNAIVESCAEIPGLGIE